MAIGSDPTRLYSGQGVLYVANRNANGTPAGFVDIGNCSALMVNPSIDSFDHQESRTGKNFTDKRIKRMVRAEVSMTLDSVAKEALELYLFATNTQNASATITDEVVTAVHNKIVKLSRMNVTAISAVTNTAGTTTYVAGTDYEVVDLKQGLIRILSTGTITNGQQLHVDYTAGASETINPFAGTINKEVWLLFAGLNRAEDNAPVRVNIFKCNLDPANEWAFLNDQFAEFRIGGQILYDDLQPEATGRFFTEEQLQAVA